MKQENALKSRLVKKLRDLRLEHRMRAFTVFRHEDKLTSGIPDISTTYNQRTCWWEVKHGDPDVKLHGLQDFTLTQLGTASFARYILFLEEADGSNKHIDFVDPVTHIVVASFPGYDYTAAAQYMMDNHKENQ